MGCVAREIPLLADFYHCEFKYNDIGKTKLVFFSESTNVRENVSKRRMKCRTFNGHDNGRAKTDVSTTVLPVFAQFSYRFERTCRNELPIRHVESIHSHTKSRLQTKKTIHSFELYKKSAHRAEKTALTKSSIL